MWKNILSKFDIGDKDEITNLLQAPPMYMVNEPDKVAYTRTQLQLVDKDKKKLKREEIPEGYYEVDKLLDKRIRNNKIQYKVKYKGYDTSDENTRWIYRADLIEDMGVQNVKELERGYRKR